MAEIHMGHGVWQQIIKNDEKQIKKFQGSFG